MRSAVIVDVDGTLIDNSGIIDYLEPPGVEFHRYHVESVHAPAHGWVVDEVVDAYNQGHALLIVTARPSRYFHETRTWLSLNLPVPYAQIYMRDDGDNRPDGVVKLEILDMIDEDGFDPLHAWDDNPHVIAVWESQGITVTRVGNWDGNK